tara:strand:+ start:22666 stop:26439 length:3774 start_codon:yes stop_codon:yes gene_type:complete
MNDENLIFLSASQFGSYLISGNRAWGTSVISSTGFVPTDFAGMNINIQEPVESSTNFLGYPTGTRLVKQFAGEESYINSALVTHAATFSYLSGAEAFNSLILHRQGPYGWPTWKQVRVGNHPINRFHRKNNIFSFAQKTATNKTYESSLYANTYTSEKISADVIAFNLTESCVSIKNKPFRHSFVVTQGGKTVNLKLNHSYGNLKGHYTSDKLNRFLVFPDDIKPNFATIYEDLKQIYIDKAFTFDLAGQSQDVKSANPYGLTVPYKKWVNMVYEENVFPTQQNTFLAKTRQRTEYDEVSGSEALRKADYRMFWKNNISDRNIRLNELSYNSVGYYTAYQQSIWELDTGGTNPNQTDANLRRQTGVGQLLTPLSYGSSSPFTRINNTGSITLYRYPTNVAVTPVDTYLYGIPFYATNLISGKKPFFNSYRDFAEDIRGSGKDYSILPEFKISDHMSFYVKQKDGNFLARNDAFLSLPGANITSSALTTPNFMGEASEITSSVNRSTGYNENFFVEYSHSDFLKYFQMIKHDHQDTGIVGAYTFKVKGIKKLLPYRGFYPHQRALQLGSLLSQSYGDMLTGSSTYSTTLHHNQFLNAFLRPLASPGILFNSLKSAVAIDYPVFTGSTTVVKGGSDGTFSNLFYWVTQPNYRLPFETIIQPEVYIPIIRQAELEAGTWAEKTINFDEPTNGGTITNMFSFGLTGKGNSLYTLAANNFFGEIPRFFLKNQNLTSIVSKPQTEWKAAVKDKRYFMDIVLRRSSDMVLSEGQYLAGGGDYDWAHTKGAYYGPPVASSGSLALGRSPTQDPAYAPYTPPYFYEDSIMTVQFTSSVGGAPTLEDVFSFAEASSSFSGSSPYLGYVGVPDNSGVGDWASRNKMTLTSSLNVFGKSRYKKVSYSATDIGPDGNYVPISLEDDDSFGFSAWSIGTKFECPALNFSASTSYHSASTGRGLWGGYGETPSGSTGVWLEIRETFPQRSSGVDPTLTGSLIDLCGFNVSSKKLGTPAAQKTISEAIVAIPFIYSKDMSGKKSDLPTMIGYPDTTKKFFKINKNWFKKAVKESQEGKSLDEVKSRSITDMVNKMQKYYLPPRYDFLTFKELSPFVMYIFEFEHSLDQQDLTDIWQGLMPGISRKAEMQEAVISHSTDPLSKEFFNSSKPLPDFTRWMVFKIKRKAEKSYFATTADSTDDSKFKFNFGNEEKAPEYNYNWPYDYFSLVELAKLEVGAMFKPKPPPTTQEAAPSESGPNITDIPFSGDDEIQTG